MSDLPEQLDARMAALADHPPDRAAIEARMAELGAHLGVPGLALDDSAMAMIEVDGFEVALLHVDGSPGLTASVPLMPAESLSAELLAQLLRINGDWSLTQGGFIGVDPSGMVLTYSRLLVLAGATAEESGRNLLALVDTANRLRVELLSFGGDTAPEQPPHMPGGAGFMRV